MRYFLQYVKHYQTKVLPTLIKLTCATNGRCNVAASVFFFTTKDKPKSAMKKKRRKIQFPVFNTSSSDGCVVCDRRRWRFTASTSSQSKTTLDSRTAPARASLPCWRFRSRTHAYVCASWNCSMLCSYLSTLLRIPEVARSWLNLIFTPFRILLPLAR